MAYALADFAYHGPYVRPVATAEVTWAWLPVLPDGVTMKELRAGYPVPGLPGHVIQQAPMFHSRRKHPRQRSRRRGYAWNELLYLGDDPDGRHPDDPLLHSPLNTLCYDSPIAQQAAEEFRSWLTQRRNV